jgi:tetratricopeptide (TPR) repeat protein
MKIKLTALLVLITISCLNAQDVVIKEDVKKVSDEACDCIGDINLNLEKTEANEKIKSCISEAIISNQISEDLMGKLTQAFDSISSSKKEIDSLLIGIDKETIISIDEDYKEIEEYLLRNCQSLKVLIASDNTVHENSFSNREKALKYYDEGIDFFKVGNYKKALPKFKKAVNIDENFAFAWDNLGMCQRKEGKYDEAIESYNTSLKLDPKGRMPLMNIPVAYEYLKDYEKAIIAYKKFLEVYPNDAEGFYGIGRMYHVRGDYENALKSTFLAYLEYKKMNSPYINDAERNISIFYNEMKEKDMLETFNNIAEQYNIKINN